jgi:hypothetical protein
VDRRVEIGMKQFDRIRRLGSRAAACLVLPAWAFVLWLPNLTSTSVGKGWQHPSALLVAMGTWITWVAVALLPPRILAWIGYPLALASVAVVGANRVAGVDCSSWPRSGRRSTPAKFERPCSRTGCRWSRQRRRWDGSPFAWRAPLARNPRGAPGGVAAVRDRALHVARSDAWMQAWPIKLVGTAAEAMDTNLAPSATLPNLSTNPRDPRASWHAERVVKPAARETYVVIIGESMRGDHINGCGGQERIQAPPPDALLFCDVTSGADSTHVSVPLLVSREAPGHGIRVSSDATFLKAFEEAGFDTFWYSVQERTIAWPDARVQRYDRGADTPTLVPALHRALQGSGARKVVVLHAYNAHFPYAERYEAGTAPFVVDGARVETDPAERRKNYDNAIDASMRFVAAVIDELRREPGETFLLMTSDHGENLQDDARG